MSMQRGRTTASDIHSDSFPEHVPIYFYGFAQARAAGVMEGGGLMENSGRV
jgi:hypothetical protein